VAKVGIALLASFYSMYEVQKHIYLDYVVFRAISINKADC